MSYSQYFRMAIVAVTGTAEDGPVTAMARTGRQEEEGRQPSGKTSRSSAAATGRWPWAATQSPRRPEWATSFRLDLTTTIGDSGSDDRVSGLS